MTEQTPLTGDEGTEEAALLRAVAERQPPFARTLGFRLVRHSREEVVAELDVVPELGNRNGVLHGGAIMASVPDVRRNDDRADAADRR